MTADSLILLGHGAESSRFLFFSFFLSFLSVDKNQTDQTCLFVVLLCFVLRSIDFPWIINQRHDDPINYFSPIQPMYEAIKRHAANDSV